MINLEHSFKLFLILWLIAGKIQSSTEARMTYDDELRLLLELEISLRNVRVASLEHITHYQLTEIWNRCWQGYYYNMFYLNEHMRIWLDLTRVSLQYSMGLYVEDQVIGFALLSIDGGDGWIAAACIDPAYRRKGLFKELMRIQLDQASRLGIKRVYLEVLEQNHALKVYQSIGFIPMRQLNVYRSLSKPNYINGNLRVIPFKLVAADLYFEKRSHTFKPAWQRKEDCLKRHINYYAIMNLSGTAGALYAGEKNGFLIDAWSSSATGAEEVIIALLQGSNEPFSLMNQPNDWIFAYFNTHKTSPSAIQWEMCIHLS